MKLASQMPSSTSQHGNGQSRGHVSAPACARESRCGAACKMRLPIKLRGAETSALHSSSASFLRRQNGAIACVAAGRKAIWRNQGGGNVERQFGTDRIEQPVALGGGNRPGKNQGRCHRDPRRH